MYPFLILGDYEEQFLYSPMVEMEPQPTPLAPDPCKPKNPAMKASASGWMMIWLLVVLQTISLRPELSSKLPRTITAIHSSPSLTPLIFVEKNWI